MSLCFEVQESYRCIELYLSVFIHLKYFKVLIPKASDFTIPIGSDLFLFLIFLSQIFQSYVFQNHILHVSLLFLLPIIAYQILLISSLYCSIFFFFQIIADNGNKFFTFINFSYFVINFSFVIYFQSILPLYRLPTQTWKNIAYDALFMLVQKIFEKKAKITLLLEMNFH